MSYRIVAGAFALGLLAPATPAFADDPNDPDMRTKEARERDRKIIRQLNQEQLRYVRERDARLREGWEAYKAWPKVQEEHRKRMEAWRYAVKMCEAGHHEYCAR